MRKKEQEALRRRNRRPPDPDRAKTSMLNTLSAPNSRRSYTFPKEQFITGVLFRTQLALN